MTVYTKLCLQKTSKIVANQAPTAAQRSTRVQNCNNIVNSMTFIADQVWVKVLAHIAPAVACACLSIAL